MPRHLLAALVHTGFSKGLTLCSSFVLTVLLARFFTPAEYGVYGLINTTMWLLPPIVGLTLSSYVSRSVPGRPEEEQIGILKVTLLIEVGLAVAVGVVLLAAGMVNRFIELTQTTGYYWLFVGVLALVVLNAVQSELVQYAFGRLDIKTANYMDLLLQAGWVPPLLLLALLGSQINLTVVVLSMMAASVASSLVGGRLVNWRAFWMTPFRVARLNAALKYSVPLVVPALNYGMLRFIDRYFLASMTSMQQLGVYTFAGTMVSLLFTLSYRIFYTALHPHIIRAHNDGDLAQRDLLLTYLLKASLLLFVACVIIFRAGGYLILLPFVREEYAASIRWVIPIALTHVLTILTMPGQLLLLLQNRTHLIMSIELVGSALVIVLSLLLIPLHGVLGGIFASWVAWSFVAIMENITSGAWRVIVWRRVWSYKQDVRFGRELLAGLSRV